MARHSIIDQARFAKRLFLKGGLPLQLIYFVTNRCNSSCSHCFLKGSLNKPEKSLTLDEIEKLSKSIPLLASLSLTGGEPFLRNDLAEVAQIFCRNSKVKNLVITTNGYDTKRILESADKICHSSNRANIFMGVSLDGVESEHDSIRGLVGSFKNALNTYQEFKKLKKKHKNLNVGINLTVSSYNQDRAVALYEYIRDRLGTDDIGINLMRADSWDKKVEGLDIEKYRQVTALKKKDHLAGRIKYSASPVIGSLAIAKEFLQYGLIQKIHKLDRPVCRCYAGFLMAVMSAEGDIYPCEMLKESFGNVRDFDYSMERVFKTPEADKIRKFIKSGKCFCTYECAMTGNILFNLRYYPALLRELIRR